jgi:SAM-dependent methyltransferase
MLSQVYDTDGNILQAIDDHLISGLLDQSFSLLPSSQSSPSSTTPSQPEIAITELGCGTGRNTIKLLSPHELKIPLPENGARFNRRIKNIFALDLSPGMLHLAKDRCETFINSTSTSNLNPLPSPNIEFLEFDALNPSITVIKKLEGEADMVLSTLVLEHLPLDIFFNTTKSFLRKNGKGLLVVTNMHPEMGRLSRAGFLDPVTGTKIQGTSFVHEIADVVAAGSNFGFEVVGTVVERGVSESDVGCDDDEGERRLLGKRGRKWIGCKVWFGCVMRLES